MKFNAKQDVEAPIAFVFKYLTDFDLWERSAMRRGAQVERADNLSAAGAGMAWNASFRYRGKTRNVTASILQLADPNNVRIGLQSRAIKGQLNLDLLEMSTKRTRLHATFDVTPRNLTARLFIQSLRLARARMDRKYAFRVAQVIADIETAYDQAVSA